MRSQIANRKSKILIVGGGPAGSSLAIRLAKVGHEITLVEKDRFPRHKLCGEFISPECFDHFNELGVENDLISSGGAVIDETVYHEMGGRSVEVPSEWFGHAGRALSLSRARMDEVLLRRAEECGVHVVEDTGVSAVNLENEKLRSVINKSRGDESREISADLFIDATGRHRVLSRLAEKNLGLGFADDHPKEKLAAFKVHLRNADVVPDRCEIYSFQGGYAGLSPIEDGLANLCLILRPRAVRDLRHDRLICDVVSQNARAKEVLKQAEPASDWLAVAVHRFGRQNVRPAENLFSVGDAAAFIDPFTGSGILMALEGSRAFAAAAESAGDLEKLTECYGRACRKLFQRRLRISSVLRHAAFSPALATAAVRLLSASDMLRRKVARATRGYSVAEAPHQAPPE